MLLYRKFNMVDAHINRWLMQHSIALLRISLGAVFFGFGVLKFLPHVSPAQALAEKTTMILSFGLAPRHVAILLVATLECAIGLCFLT